MELRADHPGMIAQLHDLDQLTVRRLAGYDQPSPLQRVQIAVVDLPTMAVALMHHRDAVGTSSAATRAEPARVRAETHRPTFVRHAALAVHEVDDRVRR